MKLTLRVSVSLDWLLLALSTVLLSRCLAFLSPQTVPKKATEWECWDWNIRIWWP